MTNCTPIKGRHFSKIAKCVAILPSTEGVKTNLPDVIFHMYQAGKIILEKSAKEDKSVADPITDMHKRKKKSLGDQMYRHKQVESVDDNMLQTD